MKLTLFIKNHKKEISKEWVRYARENIHVINKLHLEDVQDHISQMLDRIVESMETLETDVQQEEKSKGQKDMDARESKAAHQHGEQRADVGFDLMELSSEFRALRASILRLWEARNGAEKKETDFQDMIHFNEAIDELWMISLERFDNKVEESKNWFIGVLGHDLRNPLAAISGVQSILKLSKNLSEKERSLIGRSDSSVKRMIELINNLLELTNLRLGSGITINKSHIDLSEQSEKIVQEIQLSYPEAELIIETPGPVQGNWDVLRLDQLMTNLITNALRHGKPGGPVTVTVSAKGNDAIFKVYNEGTPVPEKIKSMITDGFSSKLNRDPAKNESYGLGLYIVKAIVDGHKGHINLESSREAATTFTITLPRKL